MPSRAAVQASQKTITTVTESMGLLEAVAGDIARGNREFGLQLKHDRTMQQHYSATCQYDANDDKSDDRISLNVIYRGQDCDKDAHCREHESDNSECAPGMSGRFEQTGSLYDASIVRHRLCHSWSGIRKH